MYHIITCYVKKHPPANRTKISSILYYNSKLAITYHSSIFFVLSRFLYQCALFFQTLFIVFLSTYIKPTRIGSISFTPFIIVHKRSSKVSLNWHTCFYCFAYLFYMLFVKYRFLTPIWCYVNNWRNKYSLSHERRRNSCCLQTIRLGVLL